MTVSPVVFQISLAITCTSYLICIFLYFFRRHKFPIAQRLPLLVAVELFVIAIKGTLVLWQGADDNTDHVIKNCKFYQISVGATEDLSYLLLLIRVGWLLFKDFVTKALIDRYSDPSKRGSQILMSNCIYRILSHMLNLLGRSITLFCFLAPILILSGANMIVLERRDDSDQIVGNCLDARFGVYSTALQGSIISYLLLFGSIAIYSLRNIQDKLNLFIEIRALALPGLVQLSYFVVSYILGNTPSELHLFSGLIISPAFVLVQTLYPLKLSFDQEKLEIRITAQRLAPQIQTTGDLIQELHLWIQDPDLRSVFLHFLESEFSVENLLFILACLDFEKLVQSSPANTKYITSEARDIRNSFVYENSASSINLSAKTRRKLLSALSESKLTEMKEGTDLSNVFTGAKEEIVQLMVTDSFKRFQFTQEYLEIKAKKTTVGSAPSAPWQTAENSNTNVKSKYDSNSLCYCFTKLILRRSHVEPLLDIPTLERKQSTTRVTLSPPRSPSKTNESNNRY
jgi:hypothetical protein